jgi:site-specific recombinase XerD
VIFTRILTAALEARFLQFLARDDAGSTKHPWVTQGKCPTLCLRAKPLPPIPQQTHQVAQQTQSVKQALAAIRMLFDHLVITQVVPVNPGYGVRGPRYAASEGKTPVIDCGDMARLLEEIDTTSIIGLRDRALMGVLFYSFARVNAVVNVRLRDYYPIGKIWHLRLSEKNGKKIEAPLHHQAEHYLDEYITAAGIKEDMDGYLFRSVGSRSKELSPRPMSRTDVLKMVKRRAEQLGIRTPIRCHSFRATGVTNYLENGGQLDHAQTMCGHSSAKTTKVYDRREQRIRRAEVERINLKVNRE